MTVASASAPRTSPSPVRPARLAIAAAAALALNLGAFGLGALAEASWEVGQPYSVTAFAVVLATLVAFVIGGGVTWLVARRRPGFVSVAAWGGLALGLVSMAALLNAHDLATGLSLAFMHVATAAAWVWALLWKREDQS